jgi:Heterokaryon incompatibility protein (HET)
LDRKVKPTIRLLRLMPNEDETAPIQCKLFDYSLHDSRKERGRQVQIMVKTYSKAHCVIVWLRETTDNSDRALEEIRVAEFMNSSDNKKTQQAILAPLQRPWFQRIWVRAFQNNSLIGYLSSYRHLAVLDVEAAYQYLSRPSADSYNCCRHGRTERPVLRR